MGIVAAVKAVVFVASVVYQNKKQQQIKKQQKQMQQQQAAAEEARKGFTLTVSGEAVALPVVYGKNYLGGIAVKHHITSNYTSSSITGTNNFNQGFTNTTASGTKNEFLHVQHALCQDGIESVAGVKVNNLDYNDSEQRFNHLIRTYRTGGAADPIATANGIPSTNRFTGTAYASSTFKLDRDDPQYNGAPEMGFIVKGRRVRSVTLSGSTYSLGAYSYSNNPALCLLDYLLNADFGRGLSTSEVDLQSFYEAAIVCGTTVSTGRAVSGVINGGPTTRNIPLYECNITLSTMSSVRDNIEAIMNTMALAELTWSSEGKYKLLVEYPTTLAQQNALVDASHYFTEDDIVRNDVSIAWPSASERYNQVTIAFSNEHEDFKTDSVTWPKTGSTAYNTYLTEDNNQPFRGSFDISGVTDPYHALAAAEQFVREARSVRTVSLTVTKKGLSIEPGDFINITSENCNISDEVYRVQAIEVNADFTVKLTCTYFDYQTLAWNVNDDIAYSTRPTYDFKVEPVTGLTYTAGAPETDRTAVAELTWTAPTDGSFKCVVYYTVGSVLQILGETTGESFVIHPRPEWANGQSVTFTVKAQTPLGRLSAGVAVANAVVRTPDAPTSFSVSEDLYQTNKASGVKARANLSFYEPSGGVDVKDFKVEYYRDSDGSTYKLLGYTVGETFVFNDVRAGAYHFRITPISWFGYEGTPLVGTKIILGLSAIPSDPTGFTSKVTDSGILLTWDTPSDLDVVSGGTTEIRYVRNDVVVPKWEIAQVIVNNISGSTTTATLPIAPGYYLIKHIDSSGNACANAAQVINSFVGPDYNAITTISEDPTFAGTKTNCTVVGSNLELDPGVLTMTYLFDNDIDLGSVESIRLVPSLTAVITDGVTVVADYDPVASVTRFAGPIVDASVSFEVRTTDDDPTGSPTWSDWETFTVGNYRARAFEFRLTAVVASTTYTVEISELSLTADKVDVTKRGTSTSSASVDTTVTFATSFYGGIGGADVPYVGCNTVGGSSSDIINITSITKDDFTYSVYNSGARVVRVITWQAVGQ